MNSTTTKEDAKRADDGSELYSSLHSLVVEVEGNIGSGKSTLTEKMKTLLNLHSGDDKLSSVHGEKVNTTFLSAFYQNTAKYGFAFQMYMLTTRLYQMEESARQAASEGRCVFLDRGAVGDTLFAIQSHKSKSIDDEDMCVYQSVCRERLPASLSDKVDMVLYLDVEPTECHHRMTSLRKRDAESGVPLSYLEALDSGYFHLLCNWLGGRKDGEYDLNVGAAPPVVVIPWTHFGDSKSVLTILDALRRGTRVSPTVTFQVGCPSSSDEYTILATAADIETVYTRVKERVYPTLNNGTFPNAHRVAIHWDLEHTNAFKRVVMSYFYACAHVTFYGPSTIVRSALTTTEGARPSLIALPLPSPSMSSSSSSSSPSPSPSPSPSSVPMSPVALSTDVLV